MSGTPTPDVTWLKDGVVLSDDDDRVAISTDLSMRESQLEITSVIPEDSGLYTCSASNLAGVAVSRTRVVIDSECLSRVMSVLLCNPSCLPPPRTLTGGPQQLVRIVSPLSLSAV